ncbi:transposase [Aestuariivirga sp.]|uniref:transposase n=1 Tax=Aestuariivirga sp. TaxID=2650926 RepID=UPI0035941028
MAEDSFLPFDLPAVCRKKVSANFDGGAISSDGGLLLLREADRRLGLGASARLVIAAMLEGDTPSAQRLASTTIRLILFWSPPSPGLMPGSLNWRLAMQPASMTSPMSKVFQPARSADCFPSPSSRPILSRPSWRAGNLPN